jgi:hypothetical protein
MKKITLEEVQRVAKSLGFRCLSDDVHSVDESLQWECRYGHRWKTKFYHIKTGHGCPECSKGISERICRAYFETYFDEKFPSTKKLSWLINSKGNPMELDGYCERLKLAFEYQGHQHFHYVNVFHKDASDLNARRNDDVLKRELCKRNGVFLIEIHYSIEHKNIGKYIIKECDHLGIAIPHPNKKVNYLNFKIYSPDKLKYFQEFAKTKSAVCLSEAYINNTTPLRMKCNICGTIWNIRPSNIKSGKWCPKCARNKLNKSMEEKYQIKRNIALGKAKEIIKSHNGRLISDRIENKETKLKIICSKGHNFKIRYDHLLNGHYCNKCAVIRNSEKQRGNLEEMQRIAKSRKGNCLSKEYISSEKNLLWKCEKGHHWKATPKNVKRGSWCQKCYWNNRKRKSK